MKTILYRVRLKIFPAGRVVFKGSILELLIAVPTHIVARYRDCCCARFMTFIGLAMGMSVMLFALIDSINERRLFFN